MGELITLGFAPVPSQTYFFLLPMENAAGFRQRLLHRGVLVRDGASFGLPRKREENERLLGILKLEKRT